MMMEGFGREDSTASFASSSRERPQGFIIGARVSGADRTAPHVYYAIETFLFESNGERSIAEIAATSEPKHVWTVFRRYSHFEQLHIQMVLFA